ncbi:DUF4185 domain-containing protein [Mycolicibacterium novocastrense]|uniref:DUF4185 domain-containing protein n=1 Tax=Mycolicibacterium novocastrense TaxID=59813 RepID=A0AAW5SVG5_MYCNV|nr:DUF4185 domain-containing protein [Mycolicibacterium novocastrense]MCV7027557.1 DUF4185 domain-containing protein [Mycolicibacterium novocastrense]GAT11168.1 uncharacterized protein RMCN_4301 [Mycolicibacterium novocastrense]
MGAARYVGRVGGLAVALGIGTAVATGHGIATADSSDSQSDKPSANSEQSSAATTGGKEAGGGVTAPAASAPSSTSTTKSTSASASTTASTETDDPTGKDSDETSSIRTGTVTGGVTISAQTNTGSSRSTAKEEKEVTAEEKAPTVEPTKPATTPTAELTATSTAEPTATPVPEPAVTPATEPAPKTPEPSPTAAPPPAPESAKDTSKADARDSDPHSRTSQSPPDGTSAASVQQQGSAISARVVQSLSDPAANIQESAKYALFADARSLASATTVSPMTAAYQPTTVKPAAPAVQNLFTAVANVVSNTISWILNPLAGTAPSTPAQPPLIWGLLAFARREFENLFATLSGRSNTPTTTVTEPLASAALAAAAPAGPLYSPWPNPQVSPSTQFVSWVTGPWVYPNDPVTGYSDLMANTVNRYRVGGTDLGIMWDNGIVDNPDTPEIERSQVLIAVGDTFFDGNMSVDWRSNTIFRSGDTDLSNGMEIPNGQWYTGDMFGGAPLGPDGNPNRARQVIFPEGLPAGITLIPTAGISVPVEGSRFGAIQYVSFMSVTQWGAPGSWKTNYSAIAWSDDNGETFHVAPQTVRYNQPWTGNQKFQQSAFVRPGDGFVYMYGTPNGRQGAAYLARVPEQDILDLSKYEYWKGGTRPGWIKKNPAAATSVFGVDKGACGVANPGNQVSEMSVQYNEHLGKFVVLHGDQFNNIVMRTSDTPQGTWSKATVLMKQQPGGIYAPMMHPWSPSTLGTGSDLYWNLSLWDSYNVMLMKTDLSKV